MKENINRAHILIYKKKKGTKFHRPKQERWKKDMETVLQVAVGSTPSRFIVIQSIPHSDKGYAHYDSHGFVLLGAESVFSSFVKIEAERARSDHRYMHLRFCHNNRYWAAGKDKLIVSESNKPEEDTTKSSCTLFEAISVDNVRRTFNLKHVQSGGRLLFDIPTMRFIIGSPNPDHQGLLRFIDWDTIIKLPRHVAFKGLYNSRYLQVIRAANQNYLQLAAEDPNQIKTSFWVTQMPDGHVRIFSDLETKYWMRANNWIRADSTDLTGRDPETFFWPVKVEGNTIAFRSQGNDLFVRGHDGDGLTHCLNAADRTITAEAKLGVEELVSERNIYHVRYRVKDARIFNERRYVAGTTIALNYGGTPAGIPVEVGYKDSKSYSFSRSLSITTAVPTTIEAGVPSISMINDHIQVIDEISGALKWNETTTTTTSVKAAGAVPVPPRSMVKVNYVGTMGTCDVPFSYTQQDRNSIDGRVIETEHSDGVFRGVNAYDFSFVVTATQPI